MRLRLQTAASLASACLFAACTSAGPLVQPISVGVQLRGTGYFCVYDVSWAIDGWTHPVVGYRPIPRVCTEENARADGTYRRAAPFVVDAPNLHQREFELRYRRSPDGKQYRARFDTTDRLAAPAGWSVFALTPRLTGTGVELVRTDRRADDSPGTLRTRDVAIGYHEDR